MSMMTFQQYTNMQLMLPHIKHPEYLEDMRWFQQRGDTIILDNGAAESVKTPIKELVRIALQYKVSEVAIPDTLGDVGLTLTQLDDFFSHADEVVALIEAGIKLGYVAQGSDYDSAWYGIHSAIHRYGDKLGVIYLPRLLLKNDLTYTRIDLAHKIDKVYPDRTFDIHLFGASTIWPREVMAAAREAPFIRSIDTSLPMNFTIANRSLAASSLQAPARIDHFFEWDPIGASREGIIELAKHNVKTYLEWAKFGV